MAVFFLALVSLVMCCGVQAYTPCSSPVFDKLYKLGLQILDLHPKEPKISNPIQHYVHVYSFYTIHNDCARLAESVFRNADYPLELGKTIKQLPEDLRLPVYEFLNELEMQIYMDPETDGWLNPKSKYCQVVYGKLAEVAKKAKPIVKWESHSGYPDEYFSGIQKFLDQFEKLDGTRCNQVYYVWNSAFSDLDNYAYLRKEQLAEIPTEKRKMMDDFLRMYQKIVGYIRHLYKTRSKPADLAGLSEEYLVEYWGGLEEFSTQGP